MTAIVDHGERPWEHRWWAKNSSNPKEAWLCTVARRLSARQISFILGRVNGHASTVRALRSHRLCDSEGKLTEAGRALREHLT